MTGLKSQIGALRLSRRTKVNRFAGSVVLAHKHRLLETIRRAGAQPPNESANHDRVRCATTGWVCVAGFAHAILPVSFVLPSERDELAAAHVTSLDGSPQRWIIKPLKTGRGKGITFSADVRAIEPALESVSKVPTATKARPCAACAMMLSRTHTRMLVCAGRCRRHAMRRRAWSLRTF
jgi:hypothetical protein